MIDTSSSAFFEAMYRRDPDPWSFKTSHYEQSRYEIIMQALAGRRYARAFEPGCSVGALTVRLATICDSLEAIDVSPTAVTRAKEVCSDLPNVHVSVGKLADAMPGVSYDLVVLSEIGYYFTEQVLHSIGMAIIEHMQPDGVLLAAHWLGVSGDHRLSGDRVHEVLSTLPEVAHSHAERHAGFRLDVWSRP